MFERFTEKAINVVSKSQEIARECGFNVILPEHLLLALVAEAKGVSLRIFKNKNITYNGINFAAGFVVAAAFLSTFIPKIQYYITRKTTGVDAFPGTYDYEHQHEMVA